jgi:signal peptidase I
MFPDLEITMFNFWKIVIGALVATIAIIFLLQMVIGGHLIAGTGMQPALDVGDRLMINKIAYLFAGPSRGEIINYKSSSGTLELKRIIGLPGDVIEMKNDSVYINGIRLTEPYVKNPAKYTFPPSPVSTGSVFVLEDNRTSSDVSFDSCTISENNIVGRAWLLAWPPDRLGLLESFSPPPGLTSVENP